MRSVNIAFCTWRSVYAVSCSNKMKITMILLLCASLANWDFILLSSSYIISREEFSHLRWTVEYFAIFLRDFNEVENAWHYKMVRLHLDVNMYSNAFTLVLFFPVASTLESFYDFVICLPSNVFSTYMKVVFYDCV